MSSGPEVEFNKDLLRSYKYTQRIKGKWVQKTEGKCVKHEWVQKEWGGKLETIKQSQTEMLELKITVTEIKISPNGFNSRYEGAEENIQ